MNPFNLSRPISIRTSARRLCTAAEETIEPSNSLYRRLSILGATGESVTTAVNQYLNEGKSVTKGELVSHVKQLRKYKKYHHALELMEWMEKRNIGYFNSDYATRIDLLSKVKGVETAEKYFNDLSPHIKGGQTYGALLSSYCKAQMRDKALVLFEEMQVLNVASTSLNYNNLLGLYMSLGEPDKVPQLVQEMRERGISPDTRTYNILITCYAYLKNIDELERTVKEAETKGNGTLDWTTYNNLAAAYVKAGLFEKAELALKELEKTMGTSNRIAYHFIISLYGGTSNLLEVHRIWGSLKSAFPCPTNASYLIMLQALDNLNDFDGLEKCFKEWESSCSSYDTRLVNVLIRVYLRRGMIKEVKLLCEEAIKKGARLKYSTYEIFVYFFLKKGQSSMALRCFEAGISKLDGKKWKVAPEIVKRFIKLFKEEKNVNSAEKFCEIVKKHADPNSEISQLLATGIVEKSGTCEKAVADDEIETTSEIERLVDKVCQW